ncbi:glycosyltransferase [Haliea sp. E17]|uniref:glycosyltransferase n=1 Tax=Haliea sp. E17 TaxID=3401576 RepID=UPI003AAE0A31
MKVGLLTASSSRQAGGLFWAVPSLARHLQDAGCQVRVFSGRDCYSEKDLYKWAGIPLNVLDAVGPRSFGYLPGLKERLASESLDILHTHGIWMYPSMATFRWGKHSRKPWVISPHGMLDPWAVNNARWKKRVAEFIYETRHLKGASCLHALCNAEADAMRAYGLKNPIAVIPNGVELPKDFGDIPEPEWAKTLPKDTNVLLFLGRLHPKKGLSNLLHAWSLAKPVSKGQWILAIAGWDQNEHLSELVSMTSLLGLEHSVRFVGPQFGIDKSASLLRANAFVLPSFSEGLPIAVLEAWAHGLPVLMTPQCNLPEGVSAGAALSMEPNVDAIQEALCLLFDMSHKERERMGAFGRSLVEKRFTWSSVATRMSAVYEWVLDGGSMHDCLRLQ